MLVLADITRKVKCSPIVKRVNYPRAIKIDIEEGLRGERVLTHGQDLFQYQIYDG